MVLYDKTKKAKNEKRKDYCKADSEQRVLFFSQQYFGWPYQPSSGLQMLLNFSRNHNNYYIDGECRNKKCLKGRGGNDVQHKNWKGKILRIWITIIGHGVSESALH